MSPTYAAKLESYYKWHAHFYDATRWSFLFGRRRLVQLLPDLPENPRILEIGCGTGKTMQWLHAKYPGAHITGIDLSADMLKKASSKFTDSDRVSLINRRYGLQSKPSQQYDLILLSYSLTMMGTHFEKILNKSVNELAPNGYISIVDFNSTPFSWFKHWMQKNHARLSGDVLPSLKRRFEPLHSSVHPAYFGLWSYFFFVGK